jgi:Carboxypeptidase regulatory-like domain
LHDFCAFLKPIYKVILSKLGGSFMKSIGLKSVFCIACFILTTIAVFGQVSSTGSISGTVNDPKGSVVAGAKVVVKNNATGQEFTVVSNGDGAFTVPGVSSGVYSATISIDGFKTANVKDIKVDVGGGSRIAVQLEIGAVTEQVTIVGGGELIRTDSPTVGTTLTGRQITDIPTASRDALDLVLAMPGTTTPGRPRTSTVNGLPKGALNITIDGINVQDNLLKSSDGFFTYIRPRTDAIGEVTVSTSNPGAESAAEGAVQIKFVTQGGSNSYHGGLYWYHRNPALNANYWFNNRDLPADPVTKKAPQNRILLNQPGGKIGGPISIPGLFKGKDKAFFFVNYEEFHLPERTLRTKTILSPEAQAGNFRFIMATAYNPPPGSGITCVVTTPTTQLCTSNLYGVAGLSGLTSTPDPTIAALLTQIRTSVSGQIIQNTGDPNLQTVSFVNTGIQIRKFPTVRFDFNLTKNHHIENIWNYQQFRSSVDFLNGVDPAFPGFPNFGSQDSNRFSNSSAWRWNIGTNVVNEARFGILGGTSLFFSQANSGQFRNQGGYNLGIGSVGISGATVVTGPSRRNSPVKQFSDNLTWIKGKHQFNFGGSFTKINLWSQGLTVVPSIVFAPDTIRDTLAYNAFEAPFLGTTQQTAANTFYNLLVGRVTQITSSARLSEKNGQYTFLGDLTNRASQKEWGLFAQDTWRIRPNLTFNFGLRYEKQEPFQPGNNTFAASSYAGLYGESGVGNIFKPGTLSGTQSTYSEFKLGDTAYKSGKGSLAPSFGVSFSPNAKGGIFKTLFGNAGQTVFRGGFSKAFVREGTNTFLSILGANPGGLITTNRSLVLGNLAAGTLLRNTPIATYTPPAFPTSPVYPNAGLITDSVNAFLPDLKTGYVNSFSFGIQREITSDTVLEVRYVGNRGKDLWRQYNLNELNIVENGLMSEFRLAQQNLMSNIACAATPGCTGGGLHFRYRGAGTGTSPLPITLAYFTGLAGSTAAGDPTNPANYLGTTGANFGSATYFNTLNPLAPSPTGYAANLSATTFDTRRTPLGQQVPFAAPGTLGLGLFPYNHFLVNAGKRGGAFLIDNSARSYYDAMTIELRRRLSKGLLVQGSYTFGKALGNTYASSSVAFDQPATIRNFNLRRGVVPFDISHAVKTNFIYELPFGKGRAFLGDANGLMDKLVGGWGLNGNIRVQSGTPFSIGNVQLVGMTQKELQSKVGVYREADGFVYSLPADVRLNTFRAFNLAMTATGPTYTQGTPTGSYISPAATGNCLQAYAGECGFNNLVLKGPRFIRADISIVKRLRFTERINTEIRAEFLNAFNNINFLVGNPANDVNTLGGLNTTSFGRITTAYQDLSTTNDPGGRLVQLVLRLNF